MDNAGLPQTSEELSIGSEQLSEQLSDFSSAPVDDIPMAVREEAKKTPRTKSKRSLVLWSVGGLGTLALLCLPLVLWQSRSQTSPAQSESTTPANEALATSDRNQTTEQAGGSLTSADSRLLGHLPYTEAPASELVPVGDGSVELRQAAAEKFEEMVAAATAEGVNLVALSGFRSIDEQEGVFFDVKAERGENATTRAEVSAPPGYSEHHTGYAVDLGDTYFPDADLKESFENTPAFQWLQENASHYSFELSFPKDNPQGVSYEPWHWRFVGDRDSLETFYRARGTALEPEPESELDSTTDATLPSESAEDDSTN